MYKTQTLRIDIARVCAIFVSMRKTLLHAEPRRGPFQYSLSRLWLVECH